MMDDEEMYDLLFRAIQRHYPAMRRGVEPPPHSVMLKMIRKVARHGDLYPWIPEIADDGTVSLIWGKATPPHLSERRVK